MSRNSVFFSSGNRDLGIAFKVHLRSQASSRVEAKNTALLSNCDGYLLEPIEWPKENQASCGVLTEDSGLHSGPCRKRKATSCDFRRISCFIFELRCTAWDFSGVMMGISGSLSCGPREVQSPFELPGRARYCSRVMAGKSGLKTL